MTTRNLIHSLTCSFPGTAQLRASAGLIGLALGSALLVVSPGSFAQITQGNGVSQNENRSAAMGSASESAATAVHESHKPQTKDGASSGARGKTASKGHKAQGAGGFDNGLYGTGAGSNK